MQTIQVDFDVFKALTALRPTEKFTYNDVLRGLLELSAKPDLDASNEDPASDGWVSKDVKFPVGTEFRAKYKGKMYFAVVERGALNYAGSLFESPSQAAMAITNSPTNGWTFWECRLPGSSNWQMIKKLRADSN